MPSSLRSSSIGAAFLELCSQWRALSVEAREALVTGFAVRYSYNSGSLENDEITLHDTREVFDHRGVTSFTGSVRSIFEIENLRIAWDWMLGRASQTSGLAESDILTCHRLLTRGTYDERRWKLGERPGTYKQHMYEVADGVGALPEEVPELVGALLAEIDEALQAPHDDLGTLQIATYLHAALVDIHPFADGNGRCARQLTNVILLRSGLPPVQVPKEHRMAYFGALDAYHYDDELDPLATFLATEMIGHWMGHLGMQK